MNIDINAAISASRFKEAIGDAIERDEDLIIPVDLLVQFNGMFDNCIKTHQLYRLLEDAADCAQMDGSKTDFIDNMMEAFLQFYTAQTNASVEQAREVWESQQVQNILKENKLI